VKNYQVVPSGYQVAPTDLNDSMEKSNLMDGKRQKRRIQSNNSSLVSAKDRNLEI